MSFPRWAAATLVAAAAVLLVSSQNCPTPDLQDNVSLLQGRLSVAIRSGSLMPKSANEFGTKSYIASLRSLPGSLVEHRPHFLSWHALVGVWMTMVLLFIGSQVFNIACRDIIFRKCKATAEHLEYRAVLPRFQDITTGRVQPEDDAAAMAISHLQDCWHRELHKQQPGHDARLLRPLLDFVGCGNICLLLTLACSSVAINSSLMVIAVEHLMNHVEWLQSQHAALEITDPFWSTLLVLILCFALPLVGAFFEGQLRVHDGRITCRLSSALLGIVCGKAQYVSSKTASDLLLSSLKHGDLLDTPRNAARLLMQGIVVPVNIIVLVVLLWRKVGVSSILVVIGFLPLVMVSRYFITLLVPARVAYQLAREERLSLLQSVVQALVAVKASAWEVSMLQRLSAVRETELRSSRTLQFVGQQLVLVGTVWPRLIIFVMVAGYAAYHPVLDAPTLITCLQVICLMSSQFSMLSQSRAKLTAVLRAVARLEAFLKHPECCAELSSGNAEKVTQTKSEGLLNLCGSFSVEPNGCPVLADLNLQLSHGARVAIVGETGAGKSLLLHAVLGELFPVHGKEVRLCNPRKAAYCGQTPWILDASVRENISLRNSDFSEDRYQAALRVVGLPKEIEVSPCGSKSLLADSCSKAELLSTSQRARVALARAVYSDEELVLVDEIMCDDDGADGQSIDLMYDRFIKSQLMEGRTCLVAMRPDSAALKNFSLVLVMSGGRIIEEGPPEQVLQSASYLRLLRKTQELRSGIAKTIQKPLAECISEKTRSTCVSALIAQDTSTKQGTFWSLFSYVHLAGWHRVLIYLVLLASSQMAMLGVDVSYASWVDDASGYYQPQTSSRPSDSRDWLLVSTIFLATAICFGCLANTAGVSSATSFSSNIHTKLCNVLLWCRLTPALPCRVSEHFSKDLAEADLTLWSQISGLASVVVAIICPLAYVHAALPFHFNMLAAPSYFAAVAFIKDYYEACSLERDHASGGRSHLQVQVSELLQNKGFARTFGQQEWLKKEQRRAIVKNVQSNIMSPCIAAQQLVNRLKVCFSVVFVLTALAAVMYPSSVGKGSLGLLLVFCTLILRNVEMGVEHCVGMWPELGAVDRLRTCSATPMEDTSQCDKNAVHAKWLEEPWLREGPRVLIRSLQLAPDDGPEILQDLSMELGSGQKLGIHGEPGMGKSALLLALLRLIPLRQGTVHFDDVDISKISLKTLRKAVGFVPKDTCLLQGTVRFNLDPLSEHSSEELVAALTAVGLERLCLESNVQVANEANARQLGCLLSLSVGEKRLLVLARMVLRQPALLLVDEIAGSDVDRRTRNLVQKVVLTSFPRSTIIAVSRHSDSFEGFDHVAKLTNGTLSTLDSSIVPAAACKGTSKQQKTLGQFAVDEMISVGG